MKRFRIHIICCLLAGFCVACDTSAVLPVAGPPVIWVDSLSPTDVQKFGEPIMMVLYYRDDNGDVGDSDPDEHSLHIRDSRLAEPDTWHVQPVTLPGDEVPVEGTLKIDLGPVFLLGNGNEEQFFYTIQLKDRAGNWSEPVQSPTITVRQ